MYDCPSMSSVCRHELVLIHRVRYPCDHGFIKIAMYEPNRLVLPYAVYIYIYMYIVTVLNALMSWYCVNCIYRVCL